MSDTEKDNVKVEETTSSPEVKVNGTNPSSDTSTPTEAPSTSTSTPTPPTSEMAALKVSAPSPVPSPSLNPPQSSKPQSLSPSAPSSSSSTSIPRVVSPGVVAKDMLNPSKPAPTPSISAGPGAGRQFPSMNRPGVGGTGAGAGGASGSGSGAGGAFPGAGGRAPIGLAGRGMSGGLGMGAGRIPPALQAKMDAEMAKRAKMGATASSNTPNDLGSTSSLLASVANKTVAQPGRPGGSPSPALGGGGLAARRAGGAPMLGPGGLNSRLPPTGLPGSTLGAPGRRARPGMTLSAMGGGIGPTGGLSGGGFTNFSKIVDPSGKLNFDKKAILHADGVDFSNGQSYKINKSDMILQEELGKGNYGEVRKVYHKTTKVTMAMKEIRLELDESKLNGIIMELDILHRAVAPEIVEFYGAFLIESCVYYCMEFMDAGSLHDLNSNGIPERELARITRSMVKGLKFLKDELAVMHRDIKPTNILANTKGQVKLIDFGVSGQLEKSLAKTNIGCQSYMAPERIKGESSGNVGTYSVSADVWSVGLTIIEMAMGCYPYPPETYQNVFAQLQAIVHGPPPKLPAGYSDTAQDFVAACLRKSPDARPTYGELLEHPWMKEDEEREVDMVAWVAKALEARAQRRSNGGTVGSSGPEVAEGHAEGPAAETPTNPMVNGEASAGAAQVNGSS